MASDSKFTIEAAFRAVDRMTGPIRRMRGNIEGFGKSGRLALAGMNSALDQFQRGMKLAGGVAALGVGAGLVAATRSGMQFEEAISGVGAVTLRTRDQISALEEEAKRLGATT